MYVCMYSSFLTLTLNIQVVIEIRIRHWSAIFFEDQTFCMLLIGVPLKMYSKIGQPKRILVGQDRQVLKLFNGHWPAAISSTAYIVEYLLFIHVLNIVAWCRVRNCLKSWRRRKMMMMAVMYPMRMRLRILILTILK